MICLQNKIIKMPIIKVCKQYASSICLIGTLSGVLVVAIYLLIGYFPAYFIANLHMTLNQSMVVSFVGLFILTVCVPLVGSLVDKVGPYKVFAVGAGCFLAGSYVIFELFVL